MGLGPPDLQRSQYLDNRQVMAGARWPANPRRPMRGPCPNRPGSCPACLGQPSSGKLPKQGESSMTGTAEIRHPRAGCLTAKPRRTEPHRLLRDVSRLTAACTGLHTPEQSPLLRRRGVGGPASHGSVATPPDQHGAALATQTTLVPTRTALQIGACSTGICVPGSTRRWIVSVGGLPQRVWVPMLSPLQGWSPD